MTTTPLGLESLLEPYQKRTSQLLEWGIETFLPTDGPLHDACRYALTNGGKRFRPALVMMMSEALEQDKNVSGAALAVEFFHTASLIADDLPCMDDDSERRGTPSLHKAFDEATALLASYALIAAGYEALNWNIKRLPEAAVEAIASVTKNTGVLGATGGQHLDLYPPGEVTEELILEAIRLKTVSLFELSMVLGWVFGGGKLGLIPVVERAANHFGVAFQVADDIDDYQQDLDHGHPINLAIFLGRERASERVEKELVLFNAALLELGVQPEKFFMLGELCR